MRFIGFFCLFLGLVLPAQGQATDLCAGTSTPGPPKCPSDARIANLSLQLRENNVFFPRGGATLDADARTQIALLARILSVSAMAETCLKLVGHSDASGGNAVNYDLSERRADAVRSELKAVMGRGTLPIEIIGMGEDELLSDLPPTHVAQRRVTIWARTCPIG